jgi:MFS transporter, DHA2 family, multidrug resistance protein
VTTARTAVAADRAAQTIVPAAGALDHHPMLGVAAVLAGAFLSTINTRLTTVGLADIRGGMGLGFDEASWLTTLFSSAQMVVGPSAAWLGIVFGPRRFLLWASVVFCATSAVVPFARDYELIMLLQIVRGLTVGTFIPTALGFILRSLPPRWWTWGLAAYAFRFVFSQNIASSLEALYGESGQWQWIFWQNTALTPIMIVLVWFGMPREPVNRVLLRATDWGGIAFAGLGFSLLYAALDQGNRLDGLNSGVICGLLAAGSLLTVAFIVNELVVAQPLIHLRVAIRSYVWIPAVLIGVYGFGSTATSFVLPDYLTRIQDLRALQAGDVLDWIALPQIVLVPLVALLLRHVDARLILAIGLALIAVGSWMDTGLTHEWADDDFLRSQIVEAIGLAFGITALVTYAVANITPAQGPAIAAVIQTGRLFGNEAGNGFIQSFVRVREQVHSNFLGLHLSQGGDLVGRTMAQLSGLFGDRPSAGADAAGQSLGAIDNLIRREAYVLAYIDGFWTVAWVLTLSLGLVLFLKPPPPNPLTPPRRHG